MRGAAPVASRTASASSALARRRRRWPPRVSGPSSRPRPRRTRTPSASSRRAMSCGLRRGQPLDPRVDPGEVDGRTGSMSATWPKRTPSSRAPCDVGHQLGGGDQGLAGHAVGEHGRAAEPVAVDDGDLGAELGADERGLVPARSAADDHHARHASVTIACSACRSTPRTARTWTPRGWPSAARTRPSAAPAG